MSFIEIILNPLDCKALKAVSLPEPGPFTSTDKTFMPHSIAFAAAMIALMGGLLQADTVPTAPSVAAPAQTYSPPPAPAPAPAPSMAPQAAPQSSSTENL